VKARARLAGLLSRLDAGEPVVAAAVGSSIVADGLGAWFADHGVLQRAVQHVSQFNRLHTPGG